MAQAKLLGFLSPDQPQLDLSTLAAYLGRQPDMTSEEWLAEFGPKDALQLEPPVVDDEAADATSSIRVERIDSESLAVVVELKAFHHPVSVPGDRFGSRKLSGFSGLVWETSVGRGRRLLASL